MPSTTSPAATDGRTVDRRGRRGRAAARGARDQQALRRHPGPRRRGLRRCAPGEVMALAGENGAGKSTLIKILAGAYQRDAGEISIDGQPVEIRRPGEAERLGIAVIYQEFNLTPNQTVAENVFLRDPQRRGGLLGPAERRRQGRPARGDPGAPGPGRQLRRPRREGLRALGRASAADRDRQGAGDGRSHPDHGRADVHAARMTRSRCCSASSDSSRSAASRSSSSRTAWRRRGASPTASRSCATGARRGGDGRRDERPGASSA